MKTKSLSKNTYLNQYEVLLSNRIRNIKKEHGIFFTPEWVVDFMVSLIDQSKGSLGQDENKKEITILEPACGLAQFLIGIKKNKSSLFKRARLFGVEINKEIIDYLNILGIDNKIELVRQDYLLWEKESLFDIIIGNPPYGIPGNSYHYPIKITPETKAQYKKLYQTWYGKYNVYGAFIEKSIKSLNEDGQLIFIVPATFMILDEFRKLRQFLSRQGFTQIIYMGPDVFRPEAAVASVILNFRKSAKSEGSASGRKVPKLELLEYSKNNKIVKIKQNNNWYGEVITFETKRTRRIEDLCSYKLGDIYDIRISPRTPEIKVKYKDYILNVKYVKGNEYLPILNLGSIVFGKNFTQMRKVLKQ
jgi:adenine-specific DNA-methyltransferase